MARQRLKGRGACSTPCQAHHQRPYSSNIFLLLQGYVFPSTPQCSQGMQDANRACMTKPGNALEPAGILRTVQDLLSALQ